MPEIKPFRAWRYELGKVKNASLVVSPPYDIISKEEQSRLYDASPYNVIRMELGRELPGDSPNDNRYTRAQQFLSQMKSEGVLKQEEIPALYVVAQNYKEEGHEQSRIGFFAAMKLDEKAVLKHENTLTGPKEDRLHLLKAVETNLSPIFGLYEDPKGTIQTFLKQAMKRPPVMDVVVAGVRHRLYLEKRSDVIRKIMSRMKAKPMFIADGHHRFEVACQFKRLKEVQNHAGKDAGWNYVMTYFSDCRHNPFKIFPTHRLLRFQKNSDLLSILRGLGEVHPVKNLNEILNQLSQTRQDTKDKKYQYGFFSSKMGYCLLTLDKKKTPAGKNPVSQLDVAVLHEKIIAPCFGIKAIEKSNAIDFTRDPQEACRQVQSGLFDVAIFLRPTSLDEMLLVSKKGLKMPQKSTYFYPKLLTGLVFYGLNHD